MAERSVTVEGRVHRLPDPFLVIATQNPFEQEGVFPLPESNLDRFLFKIYIDYTDYEHEVDMLRLPHTGVTPDMLGEIMPLLGIVGLDKAASSSTQRSSRRRSPATRSASSARRARSTASCWAPARAAIHLMSATKANARLEGRDTVTVDDVRDGALRAPAPPHRRRRGPHARGRAADGLFYPPLSDDGRGGRPPHTLFASPASACSSARCVTTRARCARYSDEPAWSVEFRCPRSRARRRRQSRHRRRASSAARSSGVPPMLTRPIEAPAIEPCLGGRARHLRPSPSPGPDGSPSGAQPVEAASRDARLDEHLVGPERESRTRP